MSVKADLRDTHLLLASAAAFGVRATSSRDLHSPEDGLAFVQAEVAGTILPRRLTFTINNVARLVCDAAGGRLLRFEVANGGAAGRFDDIEAADQNAATAATLARAIHEICEGGGAISVCSGPSSGEALPPGGGCGADALIAAFDLSRDVDPSSTDTFTRFLAIAGPAVLAAAYMDDDMLYPMAGDDAAVDVLVDTLEWLLDDIEAAGDVGGADDGLIGLGLGQGAAHDIAVVTVQGQHLYALVQTGGNAALVAAWYQVSGLGQRHNLCAGGHNAG